MSCGDVPPVPALVHQHVPVSDVLGGNPGMGTGRSETPLSLLCGAKSALARPQVPGSHCRSLPGVDGLELLKRSALHFNN